jgi:phenylpyruvate tautomerase PptA (4-oxalocrotonate tautomerase family)
MPFVRIDVIEGRSENDVRELLDAAHRALVTAFEISENDRYQLIQEHKASHFKIDDTGLGIVRTCHIVVVSMTTTPRSDAAKQLFYRALCRELEDSCGIASSDVIVSISTTSNADWSLGLGDAQLIWGI